MLRADRFPPGVIFGLSVTMHMDAGKLPQVSPRYAPTTSFKVPMLKKLTTCPVGLVLMLSPGIETVCANTPEMWETASQPVS